MKKKSNLVIITINDNKTRATALSRAKSTEVRYEIVPMYE
jgi:hypothetical protein